MLQKKPSKDGPQKTTQGWVITLTKAAVSSGDLEGEVEVSDGWVVHEKLCAEHELLVSVSCGVTRFIGSQNIITTHINKPKSDNA